MERIPRWVFCLVVIICLATFAPSLAMGADDKKDDKKDEAEDTNFTLTETLKETALTDAEKKLLKEREKDLMKQAAEMVTARLVDEDSKMLTAICKYTIANVKDWSAFAGQASAGDYSGLMKLVGEVAANPVHKFVEDSLPDGTVKDAYKFFVDNAIDAGKAAAIAMMNPNKTWAEVGEEFWKEAKSSTKKYLEKKTEELPSTIINYVFGEGKALGYSVGDLYVLFVKTELQVIEVWNATYDMGSQDKLYAMYRADRLRGLSHEDAFGNVRELLDTDGRYWKAFGRDTTAEAVSGLFAELYRQSPVSERMGEWLRARLKEKIDEEKKKQMDPEKAMDNARTKVQAAVTKWIKESRDKEEELMEKEMVTLIKKKRDAAVAEATKQRDLLVGATRRIKEFCATFESGETKLEKLYENLQALQTEVRNLPALIADGKRAQAYSRDAKKLNDSAANLERLLNDLEKSVDLAGQAGTRACRSYEQISKAQTRQHGLALVNQTIAEGKIAARETGTAETKAKRLKQAQDEATNFTRTFITTYTPQQVSQMQETINRIQSILEKIDGKEAAAIPTEFKARIKELSDCVSKGTLLMNYATGTREWIKKKLEPFPANKAIRDILQTSDTAYTDAKSCYDLMKFRWQTGGPRWSTRQTPQSPTIDQATRTSAKAVLAAPAQAKGINLSEAVRRMTDVREKSQARMAELALAKQTYEKCVQQAISMQQRRIDLGRIPLKVGCTPSIAPAGASVQCSARIDDAKALQNLNSLPSVGGRWGYYWYVNNALQNVTGDAISVAMPAAGGQVTARLMVDNPTAVIAGPAVSYDLDYGA